MTVPYVCSTCCHRIAQQPLFAGSRHVARASSSAVEDLLSHPSPVPRPRPHQPRYSRPHRNAHDEPHKRQEPSTADFTSYIASATTRSAGRYSRQPRPRLPDSRDSPKPGGRPPRSFTSELEELLRSGNLEQAWLFFAEHYTNKDSTALTKPSFRDVAKVRSGAVFANLLSQLIVAWQAHIQGDLDASQLPLLSDVVERFEKAGLASPNIYSKTIWPMSVALLRAGSCGQSLAEQRYQDSLRDLMDVWKLCLSKQSDTPRTDQDLSPQLDSSPWLFVRDELLSERRAYQSRHFDDWFSIFVPLAQFDKGRSNSLAASAIITYDAIVYTLPRIASSEVESEPYSDFVTSIDLLFQHAVRDSRRVEAFSQHLKGAGVAHEAIDGLLERLDIHVKKGIPAAVERRAPRPNNVDSSSQIIINSLGRAVEQQNLDSVEKLWKKFQAAHRPEGAATSERTGTVKVYEQFLIAFFKLRRPQSALNVWNSMVQSNIAPTVSTWSVMMKGCHISRDTHIMETMWRRMRESGVEPDVQAWNIRIYGLLKVGQVLEGLRALDQMGREWIAATRPQRGLSNPQPVTVPKPDTTILNSALSALGNRGREHFPKVLAWSQSFGIEPDVITYNTLLNIALTHGKQEETAQILKSMAEANVGPDSDTFTILLNSMFYSSVLRGLSHAEQEAKVMNFIKSVESSGVPINEKGYGLLVDRLLKEYQNLSAVQKILAHMASKQIEPTPHIYTILMTHYFDSAKPDFYAIDALWNQILSRHNGYGAPLDVIFYDRMVEGFARHGDVGRTMAFLTRMSKEGKRPGWLAMAAVVQCLAEKNEWDRLVQIVLDCRNQEGLLSAGLRGVKGQPQFWQLVEDLGVLDNVGRTVK